MKVQACAGCALLTANWWFFTLGLYTGMLEHAQYLACFVKVISPFSFI
jgi:hypothetical protein